MAIITIQGQAERQMGIHYTVDTDLPPLGVGGMGQVYKGYRVDERTGVQQEAAIKFLFEDLPQNAIERSRREASIMIQSENLVEMYGFIEVEETDAMGNVVGRHYHVASELLDGVALDDLLQGKVTDAKGEPFVFAQDLYRRYQNDRVGFAVKIIKAVLSGIMALHDKGYIHRDIDPSNIMITKNGKIKLIDFGIARQIENLEQTQRRQLTTAGQFMGKASYAAPELVVGDVASQNETTDIYAIGILLFELIAGHLPFDGPIHEVLDMQLRAPLPLGEIQNPWVRDIIAKATAKRQSDRYASAAEFRVALEQLSRNSDPGRRRQQQQPPLPGGMPPLPQQGPISQQGAGPNHPRQPMPQQPSEPPVMPARQPENPAAGRSGATNPNLIKIGGVVAAAIVLAIIGILAFGGGDDTSTGGDIQQTASTQQTAGENSTAGQQSPVSGESVDAALALLADPSKATDGIEMLTKMGNQDGPQAAMALFELSQLYIQESYYRHDKAILDNIKSQIKQDNKRAHQLNELALQKDPNCYQAIYELATDYLAGEARGAVDRDVNKARALYTKGKQLAEAASDEYYIERIEMRLRALE